MMIGIGSDCLSAAIDPLGAELASLRDAQGRELMTDADPAFWTGHAPLLFPIVGALNGGAYRLGDQRHAVAQHGLARRLPFALTGRTRASATFRLTDSAATRAAYPFAFTLDADYRIEGATLAMTVTVTNSGDTDLPASFGWHPAFAWPLPYGQPRAAHRILFDAAEPDPLCVLEGGVIVAEDRPSPLQGRTLALCDQLFARDALVWRAARSRGCLYGAAEGPQLRLDWSDNHPSLGIWTKPGAHYVCIEPWDGHADPAGFEGDIRDKPGIRRIPPGASRSYRLGVTWMAQPRAAAMPRI